MLAKENCPKLLRRNVNPRRDRHMSLKDRDHVVRKQTANLALFPLYSPFYCRALQEPESCPLERTDYVNLWSSVQDKM